MPSTDPTRNSHFHAVRFYKDAESLCRIVGDFLGEGFRDGNPAIVIATPKHRQTLVRLLGEGGVDADQLQADGQLFLLDAAEQLATFMVDGVPSASLFRNSIIPVIQQASGGRQDCVVRTYGEMVDVLWKSGQTVAATRLETLWNELARTQSFSLLCGYAMGNFYKDSVVEEICSHHSHVMSENGTLAFVS